MEDLQSVEAVARVDPKVIEQCVISGIPEEDMYKVYCDGMNLVTFGVRCLGLNSLDNWLRRKIWK